MAPWKIRFEMDPSASWIWNTADAHNNFPSQECYSFKTTIQGVRGKKVYVYYNIDNNGSAFLNGIKLDRVYQPGVTGRYVRLQNDAIPGNILNITEVEVFDKQGKSLANGKTVTMSSKFKADEFPADRLVNGIFNDFAATNPENSPWMQIDLGQPADIARIKVTNRFDEWRDRLIGTKVMILDASEKVVFTSAPLNNAYQQEIVIPTKVIGDGTSHFEGDLLTGCNDLEVQARNEAGNIDNPAGVILTAIGEDGSILAHTDSSWTWSTCGDPKTSACGSGQSLACEDISGNYKVLDNNGNQLQNTSGSVYLDVKTCKGTLNINGSSTEIYATSSNTFKLVAGAGFYADECVFSDNEKMKWKGSGHTWVRIPKPDVPKTVAPVVKHGNNGTVSCNEYCAGTWDTGHKGMCVSAKDTNTDKSIDCTVKRGLNSKEVTCMCEPEPDMSKYVMKRGNNGTVSCDTYCAGDWSGGPKGLCFDAVDTSNNQSIGCSAPRGLGPDITCMCGTI
jgi:hypothetical protein